MYDSDNFLDDFRKKKHKENVLFSTSFSHRNVKKMLFKSFLLQLV